MKIRNFVKSFAALVAFFTPSDGKGYYERKGQKNVTRGVVKKPIYRVDLADEGIEAITVVSLTCNLTLKCGIIEFSLPVLNISHEYSYEHSCEYSYGDSIDLVAIPTLLGSLVSFEVAGTSKEYFAIQDLLGKDLTFIVDNYKEGVEILGEGFVISLGVDPPIGGVLTPIDFEIRIIGDVEIEIQ